MTAISLYIQQLMMPIIQATSGIFQLVHTIDNPNFYSESKYDYFGDTAASCNTYTLSGCHSESGSTGYDQGAAYLFNNSTGELVHTWISPDQADDDRDGDSFGYSVAVCESYSIIGAPYEDTDEYDYSGRAYIFDNATGELLHTIYNPSAPGELDSDMFGWSVGICESYAIVGTEGEDFDPIANDDSGKAFIYDTLTGNLLHTLENPNPYGTVDGDMFGEAVAITESYAIVGAPYEDVATATSSGKAYIFDPATGNLLHTLNNPSATNSEYKDYFGGAVAICENYAIVGAVGEDEDYAVDDYHYGGRAYIYDTLTGGLLHTLNNPDPDGDPVSDNFADFVAISDTYSIVTGWYENDIVTGKNKGLVYIYDNATGNLLHTLEKPGPLDPDGFGHEYFGSAVSISETIAGAGEYWASDPDGAAQAGKLHLFNPATGNLAYTLANPNAHGGTTNDYFGTTSAMTDSYAIVGAPGEDSLSGTGSGAAYIFDPISGALIHTLENPNAYDTGVDDVFGSSLGICETYSIVGAPNEDDATGTYSGAAYIFENASGNLLHTLTNQNDYNTGASDYFGYAVGISESYAVVGAYKEDTGVATDSGIAYVYDTSTGNLLHTLRNPSPNNTLDTDYFGRAVGITELYTVVGAYMEDEADGTLNSGVVYVFSNTDGSLVHTIANPNDFGTAASDSFGIVLAVSDSYIAVAAYMEDYVAGSSSGRVYLFDMETGNLVYTLDNPNAFGTMTNDYFGFALAVTETHTIASAYQEDQDLGQNAGKVYIFDNATGDLLNTIDDPNTFAYAQLDYFGYSVGINSTHAIACTKHEADELGVSSGKAHIYELGALQ